MGIEEETRAVKVVLEDPDLFSRLVIGFPLYGYQRRALGPIVDSILDREGLEFLLVFPRQSGKNEAVAQLLVLLLNIFQRRGGNMVYGAIGDGLGRGIRRLEERLDNVWNKGRWRRRGKPVRRGLGKAAVVFLSSHTQAFARGETAHWLLVIDELQDQDASHMEAVFEPMRAANNATALYIGTVKTTTDALWLKKQELEWLQDRDGKQRVMIVDPETVIADNPQYGRFLQAKIDKLGRKHPIVASEYFNEPIEGAGGLFDERRLQLMRGEHARQKEPRPDGTYLATLDVAGQDEAATDPIAQLQNPGRDYTVAHIFELDVSGELPAYRAVDVFVDHGSRHFQDVPGRPRLADRLMAYLNHWNVRHLVADESGVGAGLVDWLAAQLGRDSVTGFTFTGRSKAKLGSDFLSLIETGRFGYWRDRDGKHRGYGGDSHSDEQKTRLGNRDFENRGYVGADQKPLSDSWWFFVQAAACTYHVPADGQFERDLRWYVASNESVSTPTGRQLVHDDRLISAALVSVYDELIASGKLRAGQAKSAVIAPADPLKELRHA